MVAPSYGEIWWVKTGRRNDPHPALVLTPNIDIEYVSSLLVAFLTTKRRGLAYEVERTPEADGVDRLCYIRSDDLTRINKATDLTERLTTLGPVKMAQVCEAIRLATGCH